jgi:exonuclease SbcD
MRDWWVEVTLTDPARPQDMNHAVRAIFPQALVIRHLPPERPAATAGRVGPARDPLEVAREFVDAVGGAPPSPSEEMVLAETLEAVESVARSA